MELFELFVLVNLFYACYTLANIGNNITNIERYTRKLYDWNGGDDRVHREYLEEERIRETLSNIEE